MYPFGRIIEPKMRVNEHFAYMREWMSAQQILKLLSEIQLKGNMPPKQVECWQSISKLFVFFVSCHLSLQCEQRYNVYTKNERIIGEIVKNTFNSVCVYKKKIIFEH